MGNMAIPPGPLCCVNSLPKAGGNLWTVHLGVFGATIYIITDVLKKNFQMPVNKTGILGGQHRTTPCLL